MEPSYDRFSCGVNPKVPIEVGDCPGCDDMMYDFEVTICPGCGTKVCKKCIETCENCHQIGCRVCLTENEEGLLLCEECKNTERRRGKK